MKSKLYLFNWKMGAQSFYTEETENRKHKTELKSFLNHSQQTKSLGQLELAPPVQVPESPLAVELGGSSCRSQGITKALGGLECQKISTERKPTSISQLCHSNHNNAPCHQKEGTGEMWRQGLIGPWFGLTKGKRDYDFIQGGREF